MYSSSQPDYQKFNPSPPPSAPPPGFDQSRQATGFPVNSANQFYSANPPPPGHQIQLGAQETPWSSGLFDCGSDVSNSCITCWCPCITFGLISEIVDGGTTSRMANGAIYTLVSLFTGCGGCIYSGCYRSKMRQQYMLKGSPGGDFLLHCCCECCGLCQEYRELQNRGFNMSLGWQANVETQSQGVAMAPIVQGGMHR